MCAYVCVCRCVCVTAGIGGGHKQIEKINGKDKSS